MNFEVTKMTLLDGRQGNTLAFAEVIADNAIVMTDVRVVHNKDGRPFIAFPDKKGKDGEYYNVYFIDRKRKGELYAKFAEAVIGQYFIRLSNKTGGGAMPPQEQQYLDTRQNAQSNPAPPQNYPGQAQYGNYPESYTAPFDIEIDTQGAGALSQEQRGANPAMEGGTTNEREDQPRDAQDAKPPALQLVWPEQDNVPHSREHNEVSAPEPKEPSIAPNTAFDGITLERLRNILSGKSIVIAAVEHQFY
jgi:DNA-binding cell septation regulator SpoVG